MPRMMPWDEIPDSNVFPTGNYHVQGVKLEEVLSVGGKLMYNCDVQIMDHPATKPFTNMHFFENFVIGNDDDLEATVAGTWVQSVGARRMKQMLVKAQVAEKADMDKICAGFAGCQFVISIQEYKEPAKTRDGQDNAYAGQLRNKSTAFFKIGEKEPSIDVKPGTAKPAPAALPPAMAPPVSGTTLPSPAPAAMQAPPTLAAAAAVTPPMVVAGPFPGGTPNAPPIGVSTPIAAQAPPPTTPPPAAAGPVTPAGHATPTAPPVPVTPVTTAPAGQMLPCGSCGQQIPALEFSAHINQCLAAQAAKT